MGNLQYQASTKTWRFAEHQYNIIGAGNKNISSTYDGWIDLFGWGTSGYDNTASDSYAKNFYPYSSSKATVNEEYNYYGYGPSTNQTDVNLTGTSANYDWGVYNAISNGGNQKGQWRVLSKDEWTYLYSGRANAASLRTKATVEGAAGYIFFPDNWEQPEGIPIRFDADAFTTNSYSLLSWNVLEAQGAVFLPAGSDIGSNGNYWSSTYNNVYYAYRFSFTSSNVYTSNGYDYRYLGSSVRLVQYKKYDVSFYGEDGILIETMKVERGSSAIAPTPPVIDGYLFNGWDKTFTNVQSDLIVTATYKKLDDSSKPVNGALPGEFSVSATEKVKFSMGNLQYQASTDTWRFAEHQYDIIGADNEHISSTYDGWIDLFGWGTSGNSSHDVYVKHTSPFSATTATVNTKVNSYGYGPSTNQTDVNLTGTSANYDWGVYNAISNGGNQKGQWRVLSKDEWTYLYSGRANAASLRTKATVEGAAGYIFFPDNWEQPEGISAVLDAGAFATNSYTWWEWNILEAQGAVFLPAAGSRYGVAVSSVGSYGGYWSSTYGSSSLAYSFSFDSSSVGASSGYRRCSGLSVRLVQEVK